MESAFVNTSIYIILLGTIHKECPQNLAFFDLLSSHIFAFYRQKLTLASTFDGLSSPLWRGRPLWMTPYGFDSRRPFSVSLTYEQKAFIIYDNDVILKIRLSLFSAFKVTVKDWLGSGVG